MSTTTTTAKKFEQAYNFLLNRLDHELPSYITYHNAQHTRSVVDSVRHLARAEKITEEDTELLLAAALFHDAGFLKGYDDHEVLSCEVAREQLPGFGYSPSEIEKICELIMVTRLPQTPTNALEEIICDADLYYLGSDSYFEGAKKLHEEFKVAGKVKEDTDWYKFQIDFLKKHRYFTLAAIKERDQKKKENIQQLMIRQELEKTLTKNKRPLQRFMSDIFLMITGVLVTGFALMSFLVPNHFFDGGVTGISLLVHELTHFPLYYMIVLANLPFIALAYLSVNKRFAWKTLLCVTMLGLCLGLFPYPHIMSQDKIIVAIFGGFFLGTGVGLCMRAGCALDGVEVLALKTFKKTPFTVTEIILSINILIFSIAAFHPSLGIMTALYSILTYFTASKTIDFVVEGIEAYTGVTIISGKSEIIKYRLVNELGRGITVYKGERGFLPGQFETSSECDIIFTVVTRLEMRRLKNLVHECDPRAFVFASTIKEATGGILRRKAVH